MDISESTAPSRAASTSPPWVILGGDCLTGSGDDADGDFSISIVAPPKVTWLSLHPRLLTAGAPPYVVRNATRAGGYFVLLESTGHPGAAARHIVCDLATSAARRLPEPPKLDTPMSYGIVAQPQGAYVVVGVSLEAVESRTTMLVYHSETRAWEAKRVGVLLPANWPPKPWDWETGSVVDDGEKLCWADPALGMLTINPTAKPPLLELISLPQPQAQPRREGGRGFVALSGGAWRYLELGPAAGLENYNLRAWKLGDARTWEMEVNGLAVTNRTEYIDCVCAGGGVKLATAAVIVHPYTPDVLYLLGNGHAASLDVKARLKTVRQHVGTSPSSFSRRLLVCTIPDSWLCYDSGLDTGDDKAITGQVVWGPDNEKNLLQEIDVLFGCWMASGDINVEKQLVTKLISLATNNPEFLDICDLEESEPHPNDWNELNEMDILAVDGDGEAGDQEPGEDGQENQEEGDGMGNEEDDAGNEENNQDGGEDDEQDEDGENEQENNDEEDSDEEEEDEDFANEEEAGDEDEEGHGIVGLVRVTINSLDDLQEYSPHQHSLDFGPALHVTDRIRLWRRGSRKGFEFFPTDTLLYIWRLSKLVQGLNPADYAHEEPPMPNPGEYEGW